MSVEPPSRHDSSHGERREKCLSCGNQYASVSKLRFHYRRHHNEMKKCLLCNRSLSPREFPRNHLIRVHNIHTAATCFCCDWTFMSRRHLSSHRKFLKTLRRSVYMPVIINFLEPGSFATWRNSVYWLSKYFLQLWQMKKWEETPSIAISSVLAPTSCPTSMQSSSSSNQNVPSLLANSDSEDGNSETFGVQGANSGASFPPTSTSNIKLSLEKLLDTPKEDME